MDRDNPSPVTILLFGKNGQLGHGLHDALKNSFEDINVISVGRQECDLNIDQQIIDTINEHQPEIIINAAAYTAVDRAEKDKQAAYQINAVAPRIMAQQAKRLNALLIHYSTDYVFDGEKTSPYKESDATNPLNTYGDSKCKGELEIEKYASRYIVFRTSWVVGSHGNNFIKTIFRLARERDKLDIVSDQIGVPTSVSLLSHVMIKLVARLKTDGSYSIPNGIYHLSPTGKTTWHEYACYVLMFAKQSGYQFKTCLGNVSAINTKDYPTDARRPLNSLLDTKKVSRILNLELPDWKVGVDEVVAEILANSSELG